MIKNQDNFKETFQNLNTLDSFINAPSNETETSYQ